MNALDTALGGGKGKLMEKWLKAMDGDLEAGAGEIKKRRHKVSVSPATAAFFSNQPVVVKQKQKEK